MKKYLLVLGMITLGLGLTACGSSQNEAEDFITEEQAIYFADQLVTEIAQVEAEGAVETVVAQNEELASVFTSWESALEDLGDYNETLDHEVKIDKDSVTVDVKINGTKTTKDGSNREAVVEVILNQDLTISSITTNVSYTKAELMTNAGLNTLLGMGTVFCILILISLIISCFGIIPTIQEKLSNKGKKADTKDKAVDNTIAQIIENEELSDDTELVAVIAAAIAASEGATSTDGFVVRSIKRANTKKWQNA